MAALIDAGERSTRSPPALASRNAMSGSACASASWHPNCSTPTATATSASMSSPLSRWAPIIRHSSRCGNRSRTSPTSRPIRCGVFDPNRHPADSDLGRFVGSAAYEAAGGAVARDLFSGDDEGFMDDAALVRRLAIEKLEQKAAELRSSWAWAKAMLDPAYDFTAQYHRMRPHPAELPPEIAGEIERIEQRLAGTRGNQRGRVDRRADDRSRPARGAP